jgi:hypothetical protein
VVAGWIFLSFFSGDADTIAGFDGGCVSQEVVAALISFVLEGEATAAGDGATGDGAIMIMVNDQVDADPDRGSGGDDTNDDPGGLTLAYTNRTANTTDLSFGWLGEEQERNTEEKNREFVAQG